jgi:hypothetical protein
LIAMGCISECTKEFDGLSSRLLSCSMIGKFSAASAFPARQIEASG